MGSTDDPGALATEKELLALLAALRAARDGDLTSRLALDASSPLMAEVAAAFNALAERGDSTLRAAVAALGATERGALGARAEAPGASGLWGELRDRTNLLSARITAEVRNLAEVTLSVAHGELSRTMTAEASGEVQALNDTINAMVARLRALAAEVARVSREVGGERAVSASTDVEGVWKDLADNVSLAEQLALVSRYKSEFLANMSHELRTPLNSVLVLAKLLSDNKEANLTALQREYAQTIHASGGDLLALINDILDLSKVEAGKMQVRLADVAVADLTGGLERMFRPVAEQKGVELAVEVASGAPARIRTDPQRLQQILTNLLSNALKFTSHGRVSLSVAEAPAADGHGAPVLSFAVRDTGIGIAADKQEMIFEAFQQADGATFEKYGGTGLGLSISRKLAALLGGRIRLESAPGRGSTFTLLLPEHPPAGAAGARAPEAPAAPPSKAAPAPPPDAPADPALRGARVLIVDGDVRSVFVLTSQLEAHKIEVFFAETIAQALGQLDQWPAFDAALVSVTTPGAEEISAMRAARGLPGRASLPLIAVTSGARAGDEQACRAAGAAEVVDKPVDPARLLGALRRALGARARP